MASVLVFGDICPDNDYRRFFDKDGPFSDDVVRDIQKASLVIGNLECPATNNTTPITKTGPSLRAEPHDLELLCKLGFDVLSLANNHILDYGILAVEETIEIAKENGLKVVGAGRNADDARQPAIIDINGIKVGVISFAEAEFNLATEYAPGANHFDPYSSFDDVDELKSNTDYVIVLYHGGIEYYKNPSPQLQKKCRKFIEAGADLVLCQHSHCIGTMEEYAGGTIVYGQGNSVFGYREGSESWNEGLLVVVDTDKRQIELKLLHATKEGIDYEESLETKKRLEQLKRDSVNLDNPGWIKSEWSNYCQSQKALDIPLLYGWERLFIKLNRILKNKLVETKYSRRKQMITMNLLRCEAHHEVVQTILEDKVFH